MSALVVDASVVVKCVVSEAGSSRARQLVGGTRPPIAPELVLAECCNAVWARVHRGVAERDHAERVLGDLLEMALDVRPLRPLTPVALSLALEYDHPIYDCYYIAAAIQNDAALATADERLYDLALRVGLDERAILVR